MAITRALGHEVPSEGPVSGPWAAYYSRDGMALIFPTVQQLRDILSTKVARDVLFLYRNQLAVPIQVDLNVAWSVTTPTPELTRAFDMALVYQVTGGCMGLTRCTINPSSWSAEDLEADQTCMFSRLFTKRISTEIHPAAGPFRDRLTRANLDQLAVFKKPFLVMIPWKETTRVTRGAYQRDLQKWYPMQGCTNCMAAGMWKLCSHHIRGRLMMQAGTPMEEVEVTVGGTSEFDVRWPAEMSLLAFITHAADLVTVGR